MNPSGLHGVTRQRADWDATAHNEDPPVADGDEKEFVDPRGEYGDGDREDDEPH